MLILSIDSSQPAGSVTLALINGDSVSVKETVQPRAGKFSAHLIPSVKRLLQSQQTSKEQVDVIAVASGPGTFTGLRVGLTAVKALAEWLQKPIVAVSVLAALARTSATQVVIAVTEAGKGYWYAGLYDQKASILERRLSTELLDPFVKDHPHATVVTNSLLLEALSATIVTTPMSELIARAAAEQALRREFIGVDSLDANYVREEKELYRGS